MNLRRRLGDWVFPPPRAVRAGRAGVAAAGLPRVTRAGRVQMLVAGLVLLAFGVGLALGIGVGLTLGGSGSGHGRGDGNDDLGTLLASAPPPISNGRETSPTPLPPSATGPTTEPAAPPPSSVALPAPADPAPTVALAAQLPGADPGGSDPDTATPTAPVRALDPACGAKRFCKQMATCAEARFYLTRCGLSRLDRDGDGTPCESVCEKKARRSR